MGSEDYMFLPPAIQITNKHENSYLEVVENCGHVVNVEQPQTFNKVSLAFLERFKLTEQSR
jgi:pimeloyl-ACP methyl ester carboxylesterase